MMPSMSEGRVLVIEDDAKTRETIALYLAREGFTFVGVADGPAGLAAARAKAPDLVVLDLMLPGLDGLSVLKELRLVSAVPVILLTARTTDEDVRRGLDCGADDYVAKPFSPRTLLARVRAVLRRTRDEVSPREIAAGSLRVDRARHSVTVDGGEISLTRTEFRLLALLAEAPGRVFTRPFLVERLLGSDAQTAERTIDAHVMNVRRKLASFAKAPRILTVFGIGYRLEASP
jgi:DNA-binding response OmpR family regulator